MFRFKEGTKVENIHTNERREIVAIEKVEGERKSLIPAILYVLDDGDKWQEVSFMNNWREV